jgi:hypothetical protein
MVAHSLKEMPFAIARDDGGEIKFKFVAHSGREFEFQCPPAAIPEIVARLTGALEEAAARRTPPSHERQYLEVAKSEIGGNQERQIVVLSLFPTPHCGIGFALSPAHAQKVSSDLATAAAMIAPQKDRNSLS